MVLDQDSFQAQLSWSWKNFDQDFKKRDDLCEELICIIAILIKS